MDTENLARTPNDTRDRLAADLRAAFVPPARWQCGIEYELFGYEKDGLNRLEPSRVSRLVERFTGTSSSLIKENSVTIGARVHNVIAEHNDAPTYGISGELSIEPGGQLEFSSLPRRTLAELERDLNAYLARLGDIAREENVILLAAGFDPMCPLDKQQWFPKRRYEVMRPFLAERGTRSADMMTRTCAVQASFDFSSGEDLRRKLELSTRLAPIVTAMFANSPFADGKLTGYKSTRAATWRATDARRTGGVPPVFDEGFDIAAFVDYALRVPVLFVRRGDDFLASGGITFDDFIKCRNGFEPAPLLSDWREHLSTLFTDVRLKNQLEMRMADCVEPSLALAFAAFWKGLLYDAEALTLALEIIPRLSRDETLALHDAVARDALAARLDRLHVLPLAKQMVLLASDGLSRIAPDEVRFLDVLRARIIEDEICPADILIASWHGAWNARTENLIEHLRVGNTT